ncbi:MAG TPA: TetR family transcriptional regulator [Mycobacteriales bacterium]|nr:TetR family transcriptional regulator [Mycobacteriales bacterium]
MSPAAGPGRRPGASGSREDILTAARAAFARDGFGGASVRSIARDAGVDQSLIHHFFGTKQQLLLAAVAFPIDPAVALPPLLAGDRGSLGERLAAFYLGVLEQPATRAPAIALLQAATTNAQAAGLLRAFIGEQVVGRLVAALDMPDAALRATLVGAQLVGTAVVRYIIRVEPLASAAPQTVIAALAPTLQRYLTGPL